MSEPDDKLEKPNIKPLFYESMTKAHYEHSGVTLRIWRRESELPVYNDFFTELQTIISKIPGDASMEEIVKIISAVPRVTALELTDKDGNGAVIYLEW